MAMMSNDDHLSRKFISENSHNINVYSNQITEEIHRIFDRYVPDWRNPNHSDGLYTGTEYWLYPIDVIREDNPVFGQHLSDMLRYAAAIRSVHNLAFRPE